MKKRPTSELTFSQMSWTAIVCRRFGMMILFATLACAGNLFAADISSQFAAANKLYAEGKFPAAATAYEKILQSGKQSPALLFNAGNAEYKAGHLGQAIADYRQAALLTPRDADLRANLDFVRRQVQGPTQHESGWQNWLNVLSLNQGTLLTAFLFWLALGLFVARQIRPALVPKLRSVTRLIVGLAIFSGAVLGLQAANHFTKETAVVITPKAIVRSGPFSDAQKTFTVHDGAELAVLDQHDHWLQISVGQGRTGWLPARQVAVIPGA